MYRKLFAALLATCSVPAVAQQASDNAVPALSQDQIVAFNQAVSDFNAGQEALKQKNYAEATAKYQSALPAVRDAVRSAPGNMDYVNFLANLLYTNAAAEAALQKTDQALALMEESIPHWRRVVESKPAEQQNQRVLASILTQVANAKLVKGNKAEAAALYNESLALARRLVSATPDAANRNLLLSALVGASQTGTTAAKAEAIKMAKAMIADGSVNAANKPAAEVLSRY